MSSCFYRSCKRIEKQCGFLVLYRFGDGFVFDLSLWKREWKNEAWFLYIGEISVILSFPFPAWFFPHLKTYLAYTHLLYATASTFIEPHGAD